MKRNVKRFYQKNEAKIIKSLGLKLTPGSGNGWIAKEDGENDKFICQLKSTDADSYRVHKLDLDKLIYHSDVSHKTPIFVIQFLEDNSLFALLRLDDLDKFLDTKAKPKKVFSEAESDVEIKEQIKSSKHARDKFYEGRENKWRK